MFKRATRLAAFVIAIAAAGCSGSDGAQGPQGPQGQQGAPGQNGTNGTDGTNGTNGTDYTAALKNEACGGCHDGTGGFHEAQYDKYTNGTAYTLNIDSVQTVGTTSAMKFSITTNGTTPYTNDPTLTWIDQKTYYAVFYDPTTRKFLGSFSFANPSSTGVDGQYVVTTASTGAGAAFAPETTSSVAFVYSYIAKNQIGVESGYTLYDDVVNVATVFNGPVGYESVANVAACERCHGAPYQKHGYRAARVTGLPDFAACKVCHYDTRAGTDQAWQLLADDPVAYANQNGTPTSAQKTRYAYTANVMNDVHMSHAMEFEFPQSMANCVTCHAGKLTGTFGSGTPGVLNQVNFKLSTCKSCHPVKGPAVRGAAQAKYIQSGRAPSLEAMMLSTIVDATWGSAPADNHGFAANGGLYTATNSCTGCHDGTNGPEFATLHTGYDRQIYTSQNNGQKFSDVFTATIDAASITTQTLTVSFSVTKGATSDPASLASITPTVLIGLYGYDSKDFLVDPHGRDAGAGTTGTQFNRTLEWVYGASHNRFKALKALPRADGSFQFTVDLGTWKSQLACGDTRSGCILDNDIRRLEIAVLPTLKLADGAVVSINSPTKTFDLRKAALDPFTFAQPIVSNDKCNACHDALAVTFHSPDRGNVVTCRFCHNTKSGGGHLEMQSRSIDSYIHAIHQFQAFDIGGVDFADTVAKTWYNLKTESTFPVFTVLACEKCHNSGTYTSPPWQGSSMPGAHSASSTLTNATRNINGIPKTVQGPGARACGSCHRAQYIKEDNAGALGIFNEHVKANGYFLTETDSPSAGAVLNDTITKIMSIFK